MFAAKYKGLSELFEVYKKYIEKDENKNTLLLIGAGPAPRLENDQVYMSWYTDIKNKFESLGEYVRFIGFIPSDQVDNYYNASDVVLFPYSRRIAASGPMALAIGHEKDIVLSSVLKTEGLEKVKYEFDMDDIIKTISIKKDRLWSMVAEKTFNIYKS